MVVSFGTVLPPIFKFPILYLKNKVSTCLLCVGTEPYCINGKAENGGPYEHSVVKGRKEQRKFYFALFHRCYESINSKKVKWAVPTCVRNSYGISFGTSEL